MSKKITKLTGKTMKHINSKSAIADIDLDYAIEQVRKDETMLEIPLAFYSDLLDLLFKHNIAACTLVSNYITKWYIVDAIESVQKTFRRYIIHLGAEKYKKEGKFWPSGKKKNQTA